MARSLVLISCALTLCCAGKKPVHERWFEAARFDQCRRGGRGTQLPEGRFTIWSVVNSDGSVPAAFVHDALPPADPGVLRCFARTATVLRKPVRAAQSVVAVTAICRGHRSGSMFAGVGFGSGKQEVRCGVTEDVLEQPLDAGIARATLSFANWATDTERAWGAHYAGDDETAATRFRQALASDNGDVSALRGLAHALASMRKALADARRAAEEAVRREPVTSTAHEALLRVCLAERDDRCVEREFRLMKEGDGARDRAALQSALNEEVQAALKRLDDRDEDRLLGSALGDAASLRIAPATPVEVRPNADGNPRHINVDVGGTGPGLPVVFIPGLGGGIKVFEAQLTLVRRTRRAIGLELPGEGFSDPPLRGEELLRSVLADVERAMDALAVSRCVVVAHGLGSVVAVAWAAAHPSRVAGLLLIDPLGDLTRAPPDAVRASAETLTSADYLSAFDLHLHALLGDASRSTREVVLRHGHRLRSDTAAGYFALAANHPTAAVLQSLRVPIRIVRSSYDDESFGIGELLPSLPSARIMGTSHWPMLDAPAAVHAELDSLLAAVEGAP